MGETCTFICLCICMQWRLHLPINRLCFMTTANPSRSYIHVIKDKSRCCSHQIARYIENMDVCFHVFINVII